MAYPLQWQWQLLEVNNSGNISSCGSSEYDEENSSGGDKNYLTVAMTVIYNENEI